MKSMIKNKDMVFTIKEENKTLEYQEKISEGIENIASTNESFRKSLYEVIDDSYFGVTKLFPTIFLKPMYK